MNNKHALIRQTVINYFNLIITYFIGFFSIFLLTRTLNVEDYGVYSILFTFATLFGILVNVSISEYVSSQFGKFNSKEKMQRFNKILKFSFILQGIFCLVLYLFRFKILELLRLEKYIIEYNLVLFIIFNLALLRNVDAYYQSKKRLEFIALLSFISLNLGVILLFIHYFIAGSISLRVIFIYWLVAVAIANIIGLKTFKFDFSVKMKDTLKPALAFSIPLIPFIVAGCLIIWGDRFIINYLLNASEVAFYSLAYQLQSVIFSFGSFIFSLFLPYIAECSHNKKETRHYVNYSIKYCLLMILPAIMVLCVLAKNIVTLISGINYLDSVKFIWLLAPYPLLAALLVFLYYQLWIKEQTKFLGIIYVIGFLFNMVLSFILIKYLNSAIGAAIATVIAHLFLFIALFIKTKINSQLDYNFIRVGRIFISSLFAGFIVFWINPETFIYKIATIILFFVAYFIFLIILKTFVKDEIDILNILKSKFLIKKIIGI